YVGVCHEVVGSTLFPWGSDVSGGPVGWYRGGAMLVGAGLLLVVRTLDLARLPVIPIRCSLP
ncbi:hypothetical protein MYX84_13110, partial [Acidobacteria bacterium AH-259-O06]|nr:hypothetical protein [Acidobacteria bacterium AH-259-O06]